MESTSKKSSPISKKFLLTAGVLSVVLFFGTPKLITYFLYLQERAKANGPAEQRAVPSDRPKLPGIG